MQLTSKFILVLGSCICFLALIEIDFFFVIDIGIDFIIKYFWEMEITHFYCELCPKKEI
jgi:hypothetical protein